MGLRVFNTLTGRKEEFVPRDPGRVSIYVCGVTPYDYAHVGNARPAVFWDVVRRRLRAKGFTTTLVTNFTDIDDKIIRRASEKGRDPLALSAEFSRIYLEDLAALGVEPADSYPRVTEHMPEIIGLIASLVEGGHAYCVDGDVFFAIASFPAYGKLSRRSAEEMEAGARVEVDPRKRHPMDFALWKAAKEGEPAWDSPWGPGRPGWHIECSAMSMKYFGPGFDMHGGSDDLIFPHHENEIAQSEAATGVQFVRYWLHTAFVTVDGNRMGKSMGNLRSIREVCAEFKARTVRFWLLGTHYRQQINFSRESLESAAKGLERLEICRAALRERLARADLAGPAATAGSALAEAVQRCRAEFEAAMDDDFNTALALAALHELAREANRAMQEPDFPRTAGEGKTLGEALRLLDELGGTLGIWFETVERGDEAEIEGLIAGRQEAKSRRDWAAADRIREELRARGVILEDTPGGTRWRRV
ncbi:MAG: cysteine--tRNA ligase [Patescibacteria group bacterium]